MDCAVTLTGIKDGLDILHHQAQFAQAKLIRSQLLKLRKKYGDGLLIEVIMLDDKPFINTKISGSSPYWMLVEPEAYTKYVKTMIEDLL